MKTNFIQSAQVELTFSDLPCLVQSKNDSDYICLAVKSLDSKYLLVDISTIEKGHVTTASNLNYWRKYDGKVELSN
jgi:hypothetical protein